MTDTGYHVLKASDIADGRGLRAFALDVLHGLSQSPKRLTSRWFYDDEGSRLFQKICDLPEYYPTRCEAEILTKRAAEIVGYLRGKALDVVDLGAGDGHKTALVLKAALDVSKDVRYVPIDISEVAMKVAVTSMREILPAVKLGGVVGEYFDALHWLRNQNDRTTLVLFLGSNIGNFGKAQAAVFLRQLWEALNPGDLVLVGFDLKKDIDLLIDAYNDSAGVTAAFNTNVLARINRELGGDFNLSKFRHYATYDVFSGAIESYCVSMARQVVYVRELRTSFTFDEWEPIHTEYSYKYLQKDIDELASATGFKVIDQYFDSKQWFTDSLWRVVKE